MKVLQTMRASAMAVTAVLFLSAHTNAAPIYNNLNPSEPIGDCIFANNCDSGPYFVAQLFTLGSTTILGSGMFSEFDNGITPTSLNYAIYADVTGLPAGAPLVSGSSLLTATSDGTVGGFSVHLESFNISPTPLATGSYFFAFEAISPTVENYYLQQGLVDSGAAITYDGGSTWYQTYEGLGGISLELNSATSAVPEPFTLSIFGAGIAGAFAVRRRKSKAAS